MFVLDLAKDPVFGAIARARLQPEHHPFALHPLAVEREMEMSLLERLARVLARIGGPGAAVPQHHRAAAILTLGDGSFEGRVA